MDSTYKQEEVTRSEWTQQFTARIEPETWVYMGKVPSLTMPGHVADRYHNFVTGRYEDRNVRKE